MLDARTNRRFNHVAASFTVVEGRPVLLSSIQVSSRFMGIRTSEQAGTWFIAINAATVKDAEFGFLYYGLTRHPALRFRHTDAKFGDQRVAISADNTATLASVAALLGLEGEKK